MIVAVSVVSVLGVLIIDGIIKEQKNRYEEEQFQKQFLEEMKAFEEQKKQILEKELDEQQKKIEDAKFLQSLEDMLNQQNQKIEPKKPQTVIKNEQINWKIYDSKGNEYNWTMPISTYESLVASSPNLESLYFEMPDGSSVEVVDHTKFVRQSFTNVIDDIYKNSNSDTDFIYEIWHITSQLTTYSEDIGEYPRYALETLSRGGGDCEDTAILIADMLRSSKHTTGWTIQLLYFDSDNPQRPQVVNHVAVSIDTGKNSFIVESTAKDDLTMNKWAGVKVFGWRYDV